MRIGMFMPTMNQNWVFSNTSPVSMPEWFLAEQAALKAEHYNFDFLLSAVKFRGFDGDTSPWNYSLDSLSVMAGLAVSTKRIKLFGSIATLLTPPVLAAKQAATISDMSGGRFGLNIVTGWEKPEYTQMGLWPGDQHFQTRYDHADEYVRVMRELWAKGQSDFRGTYFQMEDCRLGPTPTAPIELVCAGQSDRGMQFCAEVGDYQFVVGKPDVESLAVQNVRLQAQADKAGRTVGSFPLFQIVLRESVAEAEDVVQDWRENMDFPAVTNLMGIAQEDLTENEESTKNLMLGSDAFMISFPLVLGDAKTVAEKLRSFGEVPGTAGVMLSFQDYLSDVDRFGREVMPLLAGS
ncbi:LLM class flavin-dependent oxidoreductase [Pseudonocardia benzenivorans]|uniref:LLM class flavin-dependent oxidoreductase n=1 Tax=Pseudonocardia benzenivorans TaxID=228005 RepID=A0ABW3VNE4_9PSEU